MSPKTLAMDAFQPAGTADPRSLVAAACRILAFHGHASGLAGQVSLRDGDSSRMFTLPLGIGLEEARPDTVLRVDDELNTLEGSGRANPGARFHAWIYRRRPAVRAIVHTHPPSASAFSMLGLPLPVAHMDACMFYEDCGFLARWPGVPTGDEEGALISQALDNPSNPFLDGITLEQLKDTLRLVPGSPDAVALPRGLPCEAR